MPCPYKIITLGAFFYPPFYFSFELNPLDQNFVAAAKAFEPEVNAGRLHIPAVSAAGMAFFKLDDVAWRDFKYVHHLTTRQELH